MKPLFPSKGGTQQFGARQFGGTNLSMSQFGRKINKNDLPSLVLKQQQKSFVM